MKQSVGFCMCYFRRAEQVGRQMRRSLLLRARRCHQPRALAGPCCCVGLRLAVITPGLCDTALAGVPVLTPAPLQLLLELQAVHCTGLLSGVTSALPLGLLIALCRGQVIASVIKGEGEPSGLTGCHSPFLCLPLHGLTIIFQTSKWLRPSGEQSLFPAPAPFLHAVLEQGPRPALTEPGALSPHSSASWRCSWSRSTRRSRRCCMRSRTWKGWSAPCVSR